jgi:hypothetical protein
VAVLGWRKLRRPQLGGLAALAIATLFVGSKSQGAWLLYVATFPLTALESPVLPEYKAQVRDLVEPLSRDLEHYYERDEEPFAFLENPGRHPDRPLWAALEKQPGMKAMVYMRLAKEAVLSRPLDFLYLGYTRVLHSANLADFKGERFEPNYFARRFEDDYAGSNARLARKVPTAIPLALGLPAEAVLPPYAEFVQAHLAGRDDHPGAVGVVTGVAKAYAEGAELVHLPASGVRGSWPTLLGWWVMGSMLLAFTPAYRRTWGVWALAAMGYLAGMFLVSQVNPRYFAPAWVVLLPIAALPLDLVYRRLCVRSDAGTRVMTRRSGAVAVREEAAVASGVEQRS